MSNKSDGYAAEAQAAVYLESLGYEIVAQNWHTRWCEIDIIARKQNRVFFVEVKSRRSSSQGTGFDYVTTKKLRQMSFAAEMWVSNDNWTGEYQLSAMSIDGEAVSFVEFAY